MLREAPVLDPAFRKAFGYTNSQIVSDKRFRAAERMRQQGLLTNPYARDTLSRLCTGATPNRVDMLTTDQRAGCIAPRFG